MLFKSPHPPRPIKGIPYIGLALIGCLPSPLKRAYYRFKGATIGKNVSLGLFSLIQSPNITIEDGAKIAPFTFIRTRIRCRIGARSAIHAFTAIDTGVFEMGQDSSILEQVVIGGMLTPSSSLIIGSRVKIFTYSFINPTEPITIEDDVCIGGGTYIFAHSSWQSMLDGFPGSFGPVTIKRGAWLAWRVFVMPNVTIGEYATIGASSVVTRNIPAHTLALGSPAKPVKTGIEYISSFSESEQHALLLKWLREFAEYLTYIGQTAKYTLHDNDSKAQLATAEGVIIYCRQLTENTTTKANIIISFAAISETQRGIYHRSGCDWFDIATRECTFSTSTLWEELRNFLSRYGVRFAVKDANS